MNFNDINFTKRSSSPLSFFSGTPSPVSSGSGSPRSMSDQPPSGSDLTPDLLTDLSTREETEEANMSIAERIYLRATADLHSHDAYRVQNAKHMLRRLREVRICIGPIFDRLKGKILKP